jgi:D-alanine-D-alanine ligase
MGVVEIAPKSGVFDYSSKYTKGLTEYTAPALLPEETAAEARRAAETAFAACGCRDYARIDFMLSHEGELYLLEINTLPGMKETSLLPMSARCVGLGFSALCRELVATALERFRQNHRVTA